ncbi:Gx transporter family protein [Lagierella sp.]|uniref:Gx transporter family protein n=1 Tax=Lagierella sp. TaxID=2849657 RepID=UPI0026241DD8|nr:Gx transporter family protein [Lagierella sp.]
MKKPITISLLISFALVISLFENSIPIPIPVPGVKLGLSNIVLLVTLVIYGLKEALLVGLVKSFLMFLLSGRLSSLPYSFTGTILALISMYLAYRYLSKWLSLIGVSEIGALFFNLGQLLAASIILNNFKILYYLPLINLMGIVTGYIVGLTSGFISQRLKKVI